MLTFNKRRARVLRHVFAVAGRTMLARRRLPFFPSPRGERASVTGSANPARSAATVPESCKAI